VGAAHPEIGDVRGVGLVWGVEFTSDPATKEPDAVRARDVRDRMRQLGVLVGITGRYGNVLKIRPPLALEAEQAAMIVAALDQAVAGTS
jgi:4-aminobutyrate aminotransferase-like enzyme